MKFILVVVLLVLNFSVQAHTWNEPWHKEVVEKADSFGLYEVVKNSNFSLKLKRVKHLAGKKTKKSLTVSRYYLFDWGSNPSDLSDHPFDYLKGEKVYAFLKKDGKRYAIATPTSGIEIFLEDGSIRATYRHSIHAAKANQDDYELLQTCIFNYLHGSKCSDDAIQLVKRYLSQPVGVLSETASVIDVERFFNQHAALETSYLTNIAHPIEVLRPFLNSDFFHVQVSALRAVAGSQNVNKEDELLAYVGSEDKSGIARVMAIILLNDMPSEKSINYLKGFLDKAPEDEVYLGASSIMDPRIGTWYPNSVKTAIEWFLKENQ